MKKFGFTLAEVLITLVIIGVVAALTVPSVVTNSANAQLESQIQKFYAQFSKAIELYMVDNNIEKFADFGADFDEEEFVNKYLNVAQKCDYTSSDCFAKEYTLEPDRGTAIEPFKGGYVLVDGSSFLFSETSFVVFDVNGHKKPNKVGKDLWSFYVHSDGSLDSYFAEPENRKSYSASELNDLIEGRLQSDFYSNMYGTNFGFFIRNGFKLFEID